MAIPLGEFWTRLVSAGITDGEGCRRLAGEYAQANAGNPPEDSTALAEFLAQSKRITPFQMQTLLSGEASSLRIGDFLRTDLQAGSPLGYWLPVQRIHDSLPGFLFVAQPGQIAHGRELWVAAHAAVSASTLQPIETLDLDGSAGKVFSPIANGQSLADIAAARGRIDSRTANKIGIAIGDALVAMHEKNLVHGEVRCDRVWMDNRGNAYLLRDPSGPPVGPLGDHSYSWLQTQENPVAYAAPELVSGEQLCSPSADIYSLGCLLYRLVAGKLPFESTDSAELMAAHASETPAELANAIAQGESGDPLLRVIAYMMAKNPETRFAAAQQMVDALRATLPLTKKDIDTKAQVASESASAAAAPPVEATPLPVAAKVTKSASEAKPSPRVKPPAESVAPAKSVETSKPTKKKRKKTPPKEQPQPAAPPRESAGKPADTKPPVPERQSPSTQPPSTQPPSTQPPSTQPPVVEKASQPAPPPPSDKRQSKKSATKPQPTTNPPVVIDTAEDNQTIETTPPSVTAEVTPPEPPASPEPLPVDQSQADSNAESDRDGQAKRRRRKKKKKNRTPLVLGALCVPVLLLLIGVLTQDPNAEDEKEPRVRPPLPDVVPSVTSRPTTRPPVQPKADTSNSPGTSVVSGYQIADEDNLLWVPPNGVDDANAPLMLLPPGPAMIVSVRVAELFSAGVGKELIDALSPEVSGLLDQVADRGKVSLSEIRRCTIALHRGKDGWPDVSMAIELTEPKPIKTLASLWEAQPSRTPDGATIYAGDEPDSDAYFTNDQENVTQFAVGSIARVSAVAENEGAGIPLARTLDGLWKRTSSESEFVALITPNFLFADGREMLQTTAPGLVPALKSVLIPDVAGALVTIDVDDDVFYADVRFAPSGGVTEPALMAKMRDAVKAWPAWAESFVVDSVPDPSWRLLATRLPLMMRFVAEHTRVSAKDGVAVANVYLPRRAVPQVAVGTLLAMTTPPGSTGAVASNATAPAREADDRANA